ncbi:tetratricopeptide repeat protein [Dechloromonas sp. TW-R-39-2]|uniref:tetratricopeptide repeat protein n=1 Tax=Dechloromonas sp. TW-R-39-2 TaxID=2654218 RepID=UPI00193D7A2F|nr:tetratricopeptide repeat protein [Dechloromonas sp. TW-R-39-2]QRM19789.1 tetratricopeptide repeat protein [Dechloromonas sp. TW-R-39-2]
MSQFHFDVSLEEFESKVLALAQEVPVVVDFWAPWCEPCKTLKPLLEKLAEEYAGRFLLAKVNADESPELAQHFGVRSIPTVKVLFQGQLVDEFTGALPEGQIRAFLDRFALPPVAGSNPREEAAELCANGQFEEALAKLIEASRAKPEDQAIQLDAVEVLMHLGRNDEAGELLGGEYSQEVDRANALRARLALTAGAADTAEIEARLAANPADHAARLELSRAYAAQSRFREALEAALEVVIRDRSFDEGAGRKAVLQLFEALGGSDQYDDLIREFRRKMSAALN